MPFSFNPRTFREVEVLEEFDGEMVDILFVKGDWGTQLTTLWKPLEKEANLQPAWYSMGSKKEFKLSQPGTITVGEKTYEGGFVADGPDLNKASKMAILMSDLVACGLEVPETGDCRWLLGLKAHVKREPYEARGLDVERKVLRVKKILRAPTGAAVAVEERPEEVDVDILEASLLGLILPEGITVATFLKEAYPTVRGTPVQAKVMKGMVKGSWIEEQVAQGTIRREGGKLYPA